MQIPTTDGDLTFTMGGVTYQPFTIKGDGPATEWTWDEIQHLAVEDIGRKMTRGALAFGLVGLLARTRHAAVVLSTAGEDITFRTTRPMTELRSIARRVLHDIPASAGKVSTT